MPVTTDASLDSLASISCTRAHELIADAERRRTRHERRNRRRFARLLRDPHAIDVTMTLTDEVMRVSSQRSAAGMLRSAATRASVTGFGWFNAFGLRLVALASRIAPKSAVRLVHRRVRVLSKDLILASEQHSLRQHLERRRREGLSLNINVLGEAVLGEREARERLERVLEMMGRAEVDYISVKLSSVVGQLTTLDREGSLVRVAERLREIYYAAQRDGVFVNLDMEEFRDLRLTLDAFTSVLSELQFESLSAGIVLQAYLPDSHAALEELIGWAHERDSRGGAPVKVRLVKGANLAMEHAEAQLHGWTAAPYSSKAEVDASYLRLLDVALRSDHAAVLRVGVASHNLFDISWALEVARERGVLDQVDIEMLEGMAGGEALAIVASGRPVLLYAPATRHDDFAAAVAYLVRRLDENTSDENYLKAAFYIAHDDLVFDDQRRRFLDSVRDRHVVSTTSRRHHSTPSISKDRFENSADGDPTNPTYVHDVVGEISRVRSVEPFEIPLVVGGRELPGDDFEEGRDPSDGGSTWYRYAVATNEQVDAAVSSARGAQATWANLDERRGEILLRASEEMERQRTTSIAVMTRDAGKTVGEADPEVSEAIDFARYYGSRIVDLGDSSPLGVVLVVPPWNFPYAIPCGGVCAALAAGNCVILKPAPETVATAWELATQLWRGGVPRDVLQFLPTRDDDTGRRLVSHDGVDGVILTGSFETAKLFTSWKNDINLLAETSGKNAIVITANADIDLAVKDLVQSAFGHAGQKCSAASLAIVEQSVYENPAFFLQLTDAVRSLDVGPGYDVATTVGPIIRSAEPALQRAFTQLDRGETWLVEPEAFDDAQLQWRPGVKIGVSPGSWSHLTEWFGPVLAVMAAPNVATALAWQNQVPYGLTAGLHSLDEGECQLWIDHVEAGNLYLNRGVTGAVVNRQPFGGWKRSSVGPTAKAGGRNYVNALRRWPALHEPDRSLPELEEWWTEYGAVARDEANLGVEWNLQRYRYGLGAIVVRIDSSFCTDDERFLAGLVELTGVVIELSADRDVEVGFQHVTESVSQLVARCAALAKVRWLSAETAPVGEFLERGISVDRRVLAQSGAIEGPRWFNEQSVAMTRHRYGNVNAGPKLHCRGLGEMNAGAAWAPHT